MVIYGDRADVGTKLEDYVLNMLHREGRHKARVFEAVLGVTAENADVLRRALLEAAASAEVETQRDTGFSARRGLPSAHHLLYRVTMASEIHMHDVVALLEDARARHCETDRPLVLRRGQVGTVVMTYDGTVFEVEFAGKDGRAYAVLPIPASKLMILRDTPDDAVA